MRFPDQSLIGDLNDNIAPIISTDISSSLLTSTTDENDTVYDLLPVIINRPPVIVKSITEASEPQIKPFSTANATGEFMHLFPDGTVKVNIGANFKLAIEAQQPNVLNVENGILRLIPPNSNLTFVWRKDSQILNSSTSNTLQSTVTVSGSIIEFNNIQPSSAGTYLCEISNDIGVTVSETITLEVINLDFDTLFYRNLVNNPTGADGTNQWNANNSDLITKPFTTIPSQDLIRPNRVDLFGYTVDMMHPRPYQIDMGAIQNFDMTQIYLNNPYYFTRTRYKFDRKGGTFQVRAYQDIDLTDIIPLIRGGVYGVEGVRALFSCYIGNGISQFIPTEELVDPRRRTDPLRYYQSYARLSLENFLTAGPAAGITEKAYVTIEEFDNESRVPTTLLINSVGATQTYNNRVTINDPWQKRIYNPSFRTSTYPNDIYQLGEISPIDGRDVILNVASNLYPDQRYRFTYGQYIEFNKLILERLNPKTTKVRISINFESTDWRIYENRKEIVNDSDDIYEVVTWEPPYQQNKFSKPPTSPTYKTIYDRIRDFSGSLGKTPSEFFPTAQDPRVMVTGLNFALLPILTQQNNVTEAYTRSTLNTAISTAPTSSFESGLTGNRSFDPFRISAIPVLLSFRLNQERNPTLDNLGYLQTRDTIELKVQIGDQPGSPNQGGLIFTDYQISNTSLLPFSQNSLASFEGAIEDVFTQEDIQTVTPFYDYVRYRSINPYNGQRATRTPNFTTIANTLANSGYVVLGMSDNISPSQYAEVERPWLNKARYVIQLAVHNAVKPAGGTRTTLNSSQIGGSPNESQTIQSYYLDIDFSNPTDTRVTLSRPLALLTESSNSGPAGTQQTSFTKYGGIGITSAPIELEHTIDPYGVLKCIIPPDLKFTSMTDGGLGLAGYLYEFTIQENSPIKLIRALHANLGDFSKIPLNQNNYYRSRVDQVFSLINAQISAVSNIPAVASIYNSLGIVLSDLLAFKADLETYAYNKQSVPNESNYTAILSVFQSLPPSSFSINLFETYFYADRSTYLLAISSYIQNEGVDLSDIENSIETLNPPYILDTFTLPPHLLYMTNNDHLLEFLSIRASDPNYGFGSPAAGSAIDGTNYNIFYAPLQDSEETV